MMVLLRTQRFGMEEKTYRCNIKEITLKNTHTHNSKFELEISAWTWYNLWDTYKRATKLITVSASSNKMMVYKYSLLL